MIKNLLIFSCILTICFGTGVMNSSAQQDFNFKGHPVFCESKNLFEKNSANDRFNGRDIRQSLMNKDGLKSSSNSSLIQLFDSIYYWNFDTAAYAWEANAYFKQVNFTYNANNYVLSNDRMEWDGSAWINYSRYSATYDLNNNNTSALYQDWDGSAWVNSGLATQTFNSNNDLLVRLSQYWDGSSWVNQQQQVSTYDLNHNRLTELHQIWNAGSWNNASQYLNTYDANNNKVYFLRQDWSGSWTDSQQDTLTYNANNKCIYILSQLWISGSWNNIRQEFFTYDLNNNLTNWLLQEWDGSAWLNYQRQTLTYDANNNNLTFLMDNWDGAAWINWVLWTDTYDANNFLLSDVFRNYNGMGTAVEYGDSAYYYFHAVTGIADVAADDEMISLFPNPAGNTLSVSGRVLPGLKNIEIFDVAGQLVYREYFPKGDSFMHSSIDVSELNAGVYFMELVCGEKVYRKKFLKG